MSHLKIAEKNKGMPGPSNYRIDSTFTKPGLCSTSKSAVFQTHSFRKASMPSEFGFVNERHPAPDFASYTPVTKHKNPGYAKLHMPAYP